MRIYAKTLETCHSLTDSIHFLSSSSGPGQRLQVRLRSGFWRRTLREGRGRVRQRAVPQRRPVPRRSGRLPLPVSTRLLRKSLPGERPALSPAHFANPGKDAKQRRNIEFFNEFFSPVFLPYPFLTLNMEEILPLFF